MVLTDDTLIHVMSTDVKPVAQVMSYELYGTRHLASLEATNQKGMDTHTQTIEITESPHCTHVTSYTLHSSFT